MAGAPDQAPQEEHVGTPWLPEYIVTQIVALLPFQDRVRLQSTSKTFNQLLNSPASTTWHHCNICDFPDHVEHNEILR